MRIATWNVEYALKGRLDALRRVLFENYADIWILTETHDDLNPLGCTFGVHSNYRPTNHSRIRPGSRWVSIWSRYPVISQIRLPNADSERSCVALLDVGKNLNLIVYGTVLPWWGDRGIFDWSEHHRVVTEQSSEWLELRKQNPNAAICVAGDYNTDMGTGRYYSGTAGVAKLRAALADCALFCATEPTRLPVGLLPRPAIDHISLPIPWKDMTSVVAAWPANKKTLSDHSGLVVEVLQV